jgi:hypothetical protein
MTKKRRFYLKPMEKLFAQSLGSVGINEITLDDEYDNQFKPGIYNQVLAFLGNQTDDLCSISEQKIRYKEIYMKIAGYND